MTEPNRVPASAPAGPWHWEGQGVLARLVQTATHEPVLSAQIDSSLPLGWLGFTAADWDGPPWMILPQDPAHPVAKLLARAWEIPQLEAERDRLKASAEAFKALAVELTARLNTGTALIKLADQALAHTNAVAQERDRFLRLLHEIVEGGHVSLPLAAQIVQITEAFPRPTVYPCPPTPTATPPAEPSPSPDSSPSPPSGSCSGC